MSWQDQGRQEHGWFGSGAAANVAEAETASAGGDIFGTGKRAERVQAVIHGAIGALPATLRTHATTRQSAQALERLTGLMVAWGRGARLDQASFAEHFFGRQADDPAVARLRSAAMTAYLARSHVDLRDAASDLAVAQRIIGLDRWPAFVADADQRANDRTTIAAIEKSQKTSAPGKNSILLAGLLTNNKSGSTNRDPRSYQVAQLAMPGVGLPPPPPVGRGPNDDPALAAAKYLTRGLRVVTQAVGDAVGHIVNSEAGDTRDKPPAGSKPIDKTPWSGDHWQIKKDIGSKAADNVSISPAGHVWGQNPDGSWTNHGPASSFTGSGKSRGRRGKDRDR